MEKHKLLESALSNPKKSGGSDHADRIAKSRPKHGIKHSHVEPADDGGFSIKHTFHNGNEVHHVAPDVEGLKQNMETMYSGNGEGAGEEPQSQPEAAMASPTMGV